MLKTKDDYFAVAERQGIPKRCPILDRCMRRSDTIAIFNRWDFDETNKIINLKQPYVNTVGQPVELVGGDDCFHCTGLCPEVCLFEKSYVYGLFAGVPATEGYFDKERDPSFTLDATGHYTECAEYSVYLENSEHNKPTNESRGFLRREYKWIVGIVLTIVGIILTTIY